MEPPKSAPRRSTTESHRGLDRGVVRAKTRGPFDVVQQRRERIRANEPKFEVLGTRSNCGEHLVRIRGRESEDPCDGGSSRVLRSAAEAALESWCTSSKM